MDREGATIDVRAARALHLVSALVLAYAVVFTLFFFVNKGPPFVQDNPFSTDPYDAVGSFAFQVGLVVGVLTYARSLRLQSEFSLAARVRLILRGNAVVLSAVLVTLLADAVAEATRSPLPSYWGRVLQWQLIFMSVLCVACGMLLVILARQVPGPRPPEDLTLADAIDDLWALVRIPSRHLKRVLPRPLFESILRFDSGLLLSRVPWLNPRLHPWRLACGVGILAGVGLAAAQLREGLPPSLKVGLEVTIVLAGGEFLVLLLGFALLGGYLGLRPPVRRIGG